MFNADDFLKIRVLLFNSPLFEGLKEKKPTLKVGFLGGGRI
jgi:hypothetical protein